MRPVALALALALLALGCVPKSLRGPGSASAEGASQPQPSPSASPSPALSYPQTQPVRQEQPVQVKAKRLKYSHATQSTRFLGGVTVTQDSTTLMAGSLLSQGQGQKALAEGGVRLLDPVRKVDAEADQASYQGTLQDAELLGRVRAVSVDPGGQSLTLTAQRAEYHGLSQSAQMSGGVRVLGRGGLTATAEEADLSQGGGRIRLSGTARVDRGANRFKAQRITFDRERRQVGLEGGVEAQFIPEEVEQMSKER